MAYFRLWNGEENDTYKKEFYYTNLNTRDKKIYEQILTAILDLENSVRIQENVDGQYLTRIYMEVLRDNPHICYVSCNTVGVGPRSLHFIYLFPLKQCKEKQIEFQNTIEQIVEDLNVNDLEDFEKELFLHDYITENLTYDFEAVSGVKADEKNLAYCAYGALMNRKAVCQGISALFKIMADISGLKSILIEGTMFGSSIFDEGPHQWNLVCVEGVFCHLDVTNNMQIMNGRKIYPKFNFSDELASENYRWEDIGYPKCESMQFYYYEYMKMMVHSVEELRLYVRRRKNSKKIVCCLSKDFVFQGKDPVKYLGNIVMQEMVKYRKCFQLQCEWIPDVPLIGFYF